MASSSSGSCHLAEYQYSTCKYMYTPSCSIQLILWGYKKRLVPAQRMGVDCMYRRHEYGHMDTMLV